MNVGLRAQKTASAGPAEFFDLFSDEGRPAGEGRPAALLEPRPQEGGPAARRGVRHRGLSLRADPRCACAAGGGPAAGHLALLLHVLA